MKPEAGQRRGGSADDIDQKRDAGGLIEGEVIGRDVQDAEDLRDGAFVPARVLPHIEARDAEAEEFHLLPEPVEFPVGEQSGAVRDEAAGDDVECLRNFIGRDRRGRLFFE